MAAIELKNKVSENTNLHEEFANIELNYQSLIAKRDELFKNMVLLDEIFNAEEQPGKHEDTYVDAYYNYLAYIKERIKTNDKETQQGQYKTLLKNLNKLLQEVASITG